MITENETLPNDSTEPDSDAGVDCRQSTCSARPDYPSNVKKFIAKWQPSEDARQKAFWKEFRKAANAYSNFKQNVKATHPIPKATNDE